jgi:hypothetical protein
MNRRHFIRLTGTAAIGAPVLTATGLGAAPASQCPSPAQTCCRKRWPRTPGTAPECESRSSRRKVGTPSLDRSGLRVRSGHRMSDGKSRESGKAGNTASVRAAA